MSPPADLQTRHLGNPLGSEEYLQEYMLRFVLPYRTMLPIFPTISITVPESYLLVPGATTGPSRGSSELQEVWGLTGIE